MRRSLPGAALAAVREIHDVLIADLLLPAEVPL
jgi:hypothetical protein